MPSVNDNFADAIEVSIPSDGGTYTSPSLNNAGNTTEAGEPAVGASSALSMWFKYPPASSGTATFDTQLSTPAGSSPDTFMAIWTGTALNDLTLVASDDDAGGGGTSRIPDLSVTAGVPYWVQVGGFGYANLNVVLRVVGPNTTGDLTVSAPPATATAAAPAPAVNDGNLIVAAPAASATAAARPPSAVTAEDTEAGGGPAAATAQAPVPTVTVDNSGGESGGGQGFLNAWYSDGTTWTQI